jgi:glyoxylate reductase
LINEEALLEALTSGKLHGAGLDVFPDEPKINPELFKHSNVTLLPHMGTEYVPSVPS